jgi:hypothetical protein
MQQRGIVGVYSRQDSLVQTVHRLHAAGFRQLTVFSPVPCHEIEALLASGESPVRIFTLMGGLIGVGLGLALTIGATLQYPLVTGGKPLLSLPPFFVIVFELTILGGALATVAGMFWSRWPSRSTPAARYDRRFSVDHFGVQVRYQADQHDAVVAIFDAAGVEEIHHEE